MNTSEKQSNERYLEISLILIAVGLTALLYRMSAHAAIVLNLFFLPVVLAGFFLGRYRAGVLSLLCVVSASIVIIGNMSHFADLTSPIVIGLAVTIWGSVLGLTAIMVGTLCDDRIVKTIEAREAHVGVVEVLARYLQSANPRMKDRCQRISELSEKVARRMRMSEKEIDDIRVAALLMDMENLEITAKVIRKAVGELEDGSSQCTFHGTELVQSLGSVLTGAFPLLLTSDDEPTPTDEKAPFGARILRAVRGYETLAHPVFGGDPLPDGEILTELECDTEADYHPAVLHALAEVLDADKRQTAATTSAPAEEPEPVAVG